MNLYGIGFDHGNSTTSAVVYAKGHEEVLTFPSATSDGSLSSLVRSRSATGLKEFQQKHQALKDTEFCLEYQGKQRYVGELALTQGHNPSMSTGNTLRYWSDRALETLLVGSGNLIDDKNFELLVVTGLPVKSFNEDARRKVKDALNGGHHFMLNGIERFAQIKVGKVLMEGAGASLVQGIKNDGIRRGIIDIGGFSTDLYVTDGLEPYDRMCQGEEIGVENAVKTINAKFEDCYGYALTPVQTNLMLYAYLGKREFPVIYDDEHEIIPGSTLYGWVDEALNEVGKKVADFIAQTWRVGNKGKVAAGFASVTLIGGGAYYFEKHVNGVLTTKAESPQHPEYSNARGYGWFANELVKNRLQQQQRQVS